MKPAETCCTLLTVPLTKPVPVCVWIPLATERQKQGAAGNSLPPRLLGRHVGSTAWRKRPGQPKGRRLRSRVDEFSGAFAPEQLVLLYPRCDSLFRNLGVCHPADLCHSPRFRVLPRGEPAQNGRDGSTRVPSTPHTVPSISSWQVMQ
jgi:hypothetical protein